MHTTSTAIRHARGGVAALFFLAMTCVLAAQPLDTREAGYWYADVPSEKDIVVIRQIIHSEWMGVSWKPLVRYDNFHDHHAQVWSQETSAWADGEWRLTGRTLFTWEATGELMSLTQQTWTGAMWENIERERYTRDMDSGDRTRTRFSWRSGAWVLQGRSVIRYNDDKQVNSVREYSWCEDGWRLCQLTQYFYDQMGCYAGYERTEVADNFLAARSTATVAPNGEIGEEIHYTRVRGGQWERSRRERWTRGDNGLLTDRYVDDWRDGAWVPWQWDSYIVSRFTLSSENASPAAAFSMLPYPNPAQGAVQLSVSCPRVITAAIECHDLLGRRLLALPARRFDVGTTQVLLQLGSLPRGYVFIRLVDDTRVLVTKRVLLK